MFTILRTLNFAGLGGGLITAAVFDDRLTGLWRLALFAALAVLDLIMIIWITRTPATSSQSAQPHQADQAPPQPVSPRPAEMAGAPDRLRRAA